jgi:hypothetical protein
VNCKRCNILFIELDILIQRIVTGFVSRTSENHGLAEKFVEIKMAFPRALVGHEGTKGNDPFASNVINHPYGTEMRFLLFPGTSCQANLVVIPPG